MEKLYFRRAYFHPGRVFHPGDYADPEFLRPHILIMNKNSRNLISEELLKECIESGAVRIPPGGEYYEKAESILNGKKKSKPKEELSPEGPKNPIIYKKEDLKDLKMKDVRAIGRKYDVKDNDKSELIDKILAAQGK